MTRKLLLVLILLTPAACGGQDQIKSDPLPYGSSAPPLPTATGDPSARPPGGKTSSTPNRQPATGPPSEPTTRPPRNKFIKWLQNFTPTGGGGTTWNSAYTTFMQGDCWGTLELARTKEGEESLEPLEEPLRSLYEGAATACLAALHGRTNLWRVAEADAARVRASDLGCWDRSVFRILDALVKAHRADTRTRFARSKASTVGCPELERTEPDHGPAEGGYTIEIHGRNFPSTLKLLWNYDETITAHRTSPTTMEFTVPPAGDDEDLVDVKIEAAPRITPAYAGFDYDR